MTLIDRKTAVRYGSYLFAYWLVVVLVGGALVAGGGYIITDQSADGLGSTEAKALAALGGFVAFCGVFILGAGQFGLAYKLVGDGVDAGREGRRRAREGAPAGALTDDAGTEFRPRRGPDAGSAASEGRDATAESAGDGSKLNEEKPDSAAPSTTQGASDEEYGGEEFPAESPAAETDSTASPGDHEATLADETDTVQREAPDSRSASETEPSDTASTGDEAVDAAPEEDAEDPEAVASESDIAEELGFASGDEPSTVPAETTAEDADADAEGSYARAEHDAPDPEVETDDSLVAGDDEGDAADDPLSAGDDGGDAADDPLAPSDPSADEEAESDPLDVDEWETASDAETTDDERPD
jgi:hypothetical protein